MGILGGLAGRERPDNRLYLVLNRLTPRKMADAPILIKCCPLDSISDTIVYNLRRESL